MKRTLQMILAILATIAILPSPATAEDGFKPFGGPGVVTLFLGADASKMSTSTSLPRGFTSGGKEGGGTGLYLRGQYEATDWQTAVDLGISTQGATAVPVKFMGASVGKLGLEKGPELGVKFYFTPHTADIRPFVGLKLMNTEVTSNLALGGRSMPTKGGGWGLGFRGGLEGSLEPLGLKGGRFVLELSSGGEGVKATTPGGGSVEVKPNTTLLLGVGVSF